MAMTRTNFGELLKPGQRKIFFDSYNNFEPQYTNVFKLENSNKKEETVLRLGGFGLWEANTEGAEISQDEISEGQKVTFTNKRFDKGYEITWEMVQDDQYGIWKGNVGNGGNAKTLGRSLRATVETEAAKVLDTGFAANGFDGVPLFSTTHPLIDSTAKASNRLGGELNFANLKTACTMLRKQKDESGAAPIAAVPSKLIVHPDMEYTARSLLHSAIVPNVDNEVYALPNLSIVVLDYLTNDAAWYVQAKDIDNLIFFWREQPVFGAQPIAKKMDWFYYGYARWSCGYTDWRGIVGSTGA